MQNRIFIPIPLFQISLNAGRFFAKIQAEKFSQYICDVDNCKLIYVTAGYKSETYKSLNTIEIIRESDYVIGLCKSKRLNQRLIKVVKCPDCKIGHICDVPLEWKVKNILNVDPNSPYLILKCNVCNRYIIVQSQ